ncbi:Phenylalanine 4-hydroxylase [Fontimonas thermophila]|uniref:Phenylalanine-4-hydroxylase n=1 Tax=Fontimonas thermophila TaxID=1076937 RepID=A0A1I2JED8_9GAMM|nr:phenylalanine 4-monooxygenase [Fontimonas thermophila]SFF52924.1 Phenylalanine 4-hydroxylase [Fontimonas thermophila]
MFGANTTSPLRGDYSRARADFTVEQSWHVYTEADHALWRRLYARQSQLVTRYACREFADGLAHTDCADAIPDLAQVSARLERASGWRLVAVPGFIPDDQFFRHLAARRFPVTVWLRKPEEFDYLVEPDIFHDFFGHVPMLFDRRFGDFMQRYGEQGLKAMASGALAMAARLYWYTVEFGLIEAEDGLRAYGAGILSSGGETPYAVESQKPLRVRFAMPRCMRTRYMIDAFQQTYFVIRSFDELTQALTDDLAPLIEQLRGEPELAPDRLYPGDEPVAPRSPRLAA